MKVLFMEHVVNKKRGKKRVDFSKELKYTVDINYCVVEHNNKQYNVMLSVENTYKGIFQVLEKTEFDILKVFKGCGESSDLNLEDLTVCLSKFFLDMKEEYNKEQIVMHDVKRMGEMFENNSLYKSFRLNYSYGGVEYITMIETIYEYNNDIYDDESGFVLVNAGDYLHLAELKVCKDVVDREWIEIEDKNRKDMLLDYIKMELMNRKELEIFKSRYPYKKEEE